MKHLLVGLWCLGCLLLSGLVQGQPQSKLLSNFASNTVTTPHVRAELMAYAPDGVQPGKPFTLGLQMQHQPGWHTYWKNPGDSGLPTQLTWTLESGLTAGDIQWPTPQKIPVGNLANYGFEGAVLLAVPVTVAAALPESQTHVTILLKAQWLVCKTECIPEEGEFALKVPVRGSTALNRNLFDNAKSSAPSISMGAASFAPSEKTLKLVVRGLPAQWVGKQLEAFPETGEIIETAAKITQSWSKDEWTAVVPLSPQRNDSAAGNPATLTWLVKIAGGQHNPAVMVQATRWGDWPAAPVAAPVAPSATLEAALANNKANQAISNTTLPAANWTSAAYWLAVLGALLGGFILNFMPCVLPVLAIKLLSFAPQTTHGNASTVARVKIEVTGDAAVVEATPIRSLRASSGLFALGVVGSFVLLALTLLAFRAAGQSLGWGFQLQSPWMVMALAVLFLLIALNLLDVLDVGSLVPSKLANFHFKNPSVEALASGALAVLIATPCTAPFMGASLGLAVSLPNAQALLVFTVLGVGMALPFIAIAAFPCIGAWLLKVLPKPGAWMAVLRHFLAWPVLATVVWLLWVYAQQTSINSAFAAIFSLLMAVALLWALGLRAGALRWVMASVFGLCFVLSVLFLGRNDQQTHELIQEPAQSHAASLPVGAIWTPWSAEVQAQALASGRPVLVDFTAAWCMTCQVNKSTTLNTSTAQAMFTAKNVVLLRADWTRPNSAIAAELHKLGRSGLPVYALYAPGATTPQLLPEVLTTRLLEDALAALPAHL